MSRLPARTLHGLLHLIISSTTVQKLTFNILPCEIPGTVFLQILCAIGILSHLFLSSVYPMLVAQQVSLDRNLGKPPEQLFEEVVDFVWHDTSLQELVKFHECLEGWLGRKSGTPLFLGQHAVLLIVALKIL